MSDGELTRAAARPTAAGRRCSHPLSPPRARPGRQRSSMSPNPLLRLFQKSPEPGDVRRFQNPFPGTP